MTPKKKPPPRKRADEYSAFKTLLGKIAKVPKTEVEELERKYQQQGDHRKKAR